MNRRRLSAWLIALAILPMIGQADELRPFRSGSMAEMLEARRSQPFLLVLWSVTCAPCREEFAMLRDLRAGLPDLPLVLVSTDDIGDAATARNVLAGYGLENAESWIFSDSHAQRLRYEIDPEWYGEMPRSYWYDGAHRREAVSGKLERARVEGWLERAGLAPPPR